MRLLAALLVSLLAAAAAADECARDVDIYDPAVFDWRFYINSYSDLQRAGVQSEAGARAHWNESGLGQGRWASPLFHSVQFLHLHRAEIRAACRSATEQGTVQEALRFYLSGARERGAALAGLTGGAWSYMAGDHGWRYSPERVAGQPAAKQRISDDVVRVSAASRVAGAIDSISWRGREYLVTWSRRGALHTEIERGADACLRCSEAGARADLGISSARLESAKTGAGALGDTVETLTTPAYYLGAAERTPDCPAGRAGSDATDATDADDADVQFVQRQCDHVVHKRFALVGSDTVRVETDVTLGGDVGGETRVSLYAHVADDLVFSYTLDGVETASATQALVLSSAATGSSARGARALGVWAPCAGDIDVQPLVDGPAEAERAFALRIMRSGTLGRHARLAAYFVVGEPDAVVARLRELQTARENWSDGRAACAGATRVRSAADRQPTPEHAAAAARRARAEEPERGRSDGQRWGGSNVGFDVVVGGALLIVALIAVMIWIGVRNVQRPSAARAAAKWGFAF